MRGRDLNYKNFLKEVSNRDMEQNGNFVAMVTTTHTLKKNNHETL